MPIRGFPGEIRQVFSNLLVNAIEAVGENGRIRVDVRHGRDWSNPKVEGVRVLIGDDGPGIPEAARKRIFEPFFTTKGERGTGLGLWVSEGIVRKHGGSMRVRSSTGEARHGTCFSLFFPRDGAAPAKSDERDPLRIRPILATGK
jgi:signal transduction histidine kinase